jgi:predicted MFS family arabinose efflux permease
MTFHPFSARSTATVGLVALAVAMGIGRFAFTPILPMMQTDAGLTVAAGGWLASANYAGYLVGAWSAIKLRMASPTAIRLGLICIGVTTLAMAFGRQFAIWAILRFIAGVMSAWVLVFASSWALQRLAAHRRPDLSGVVFSGVGTGIIAAGVICLILMEWSAGSATAWQVFGLLSLTLTAIVWRAFDSNDDAGRNEIPNAPAHWDRQAKQLIWCYGISGFGYIIPATFLPAMARDIVPDPAIFGWSWPVFGTAAVVSTLAAAALLAHAGNRLIWAVCHFIMGIGVVLPVFTPGIAAIMVAGLCVGGTFMVIVMTALREARAVGGIHGTALIAAVTTSFAVGQILGPVAVSYLVDATGTFSPALLLASMLLIASAFVLLHRPTASAV